MKQWDPPSDPLVFGQMLALLAHDLRNPLSALQSNLSYLQTVLVRGASPNPEVSEAISDGLVSCDGLAHIIDNVDLVAQRLRAAPAPPMLPTALGGLVRQAVDATRALARTLGVSVKVVVSDAGEHARVAVHREWVMGALLNLTRNALQFAPPGSRVELRVDAAGDRVRVAFCDDGPALPLESDEQAFGLERQLASKSSGEGRYQRWLGLYIAAFAARAMGGSLEVAVPVAPFASCLILTVPSIDEGRSTAV